MEKKFENLEELFDNILHGGEIEFKVFSREYAILPTADGILMLEKDNEESQILYKAMECILEYPICGKTFKDVFDDIEILFRCF